jgi:DNA phosphorothioation-associated putative methyltransferase
MDIERHRTAIVRDALSKPVALALSDGILASGATVFDYGCGLGGDIQRLAALGYDVGGWDPGHLPDSELRPADVVNLGYVVNVIENPPERTEVLGRAWALAKSVLLVAARLDFESRNVSGQRFADGILTTKATFQKFYSHEELRAWIDSTLGVQSVAAAPGVFYIFRDEIQTQSFLARRTRHRLAPIHRVRLSETLYEKNRDVLDPLLNFIQTRGRPPEPFEIPEAALVQDRFRSIKAALAVVRRVTGDEAWLGARAAATDDLLVYLALAAFRGRPRFSQLPPDVQLDVKSFLGSYKEACLAADALLFKLADQSAIDRACLASPIGKLTHEALYIHVSALSNLAPLLRVYEGCGRALTGAVEGTTIIKLNRIEPKVSYLAYPDFDADPHPALSTSVRAHLRRLDLKFRDFRGSTNPPILHRKETFVATDYPFRDAFASLTAQEEEMGLLSDTLAIGTRNRWLEVLASHNLRLRGHELVGQEVDVVLDQQSE